MKKEESFCRQSRRYQRLYEESGGERGNEMRHSTYYHSYFRSFSELRVPGRFHRKIVRRYQGRRFELKLTGFRRALCDGMVCLLYLLSAWMFWNGMRLDVQSFAAIPAAAALIVYVLFVPLLVEYVTRKKSMSEFEWETTHKRLIFFSRSESILLLLCFVHLVIGMTVHGGAVTDWRCISLVCGAGMLFAMSVLEQRIPFCEHAADLDLSKDEVLIL